MTAEYIIPSAPPRLPTCKPVSPAEEGIRGQKNDGDVMADKSAITFENISNDVIEKWQGIADLLASIISVPAFVASGYAEDPVMLDPAAYGFNGALAKPFMKAQLAEMLNRYQTTIRQRD